MRRELFGNGLRSLLSGVLSAGLVFCLAPTAMAEPEHGGSGDGTTMQAADQPESDGLLVVFEKGTSTKKARRALGVDAVSDASLAAGSKTAPARFAKADVASGSTREEAIRELESRPGVAYVQPNYVYHLEGSSERGAKPRPARVTTNDPLATSSREWQLDSIGARDAWEYAKGNNKVTVCVMDTGVQMDHVDLKDNIVAPYDVTGDARTDTSASVPDDSPDDQDGHGTHVAGIIAGRSNNGIGISGVSYNANIMPMRVFYHSDRYQESITESVDVASALSHLLSRANSDVNEDGVRGTIAEEYNVRVINMSFGGEWPTGEEATDSDQAVLDLVDKAWDAGIVTVAASGNESTNTAHWPSDHPTCVSVIALDADDSRASYSNYGSAKDISAPGTNVYSTLNRSEGLASGTDIETFDDKSYYYGPMSGTSMASPVVAGALALMFASNPNLSAEAAREALYDTATDLGAPGWDGQFGWGKVNALAAVKKVAYNAVTSIDGLPAKASVGQDVRLSGAVAPSDATRKKVSYRIEDAGTTGATLSGSTFRAAHRGTATLTARVESGIDLGTDYTQQFRIEVGPAELDEAGVKVTGLRDVYPYQGVPVEPSVEVRVGNALLSRGTDYELSCQNNLDAGTAELAIVGEGDYAGSVTKKFTIASAPLSSATIGTVTPRVYSGRQQAPGVSVRFGDRYLVSGIDYLASYRDNARVGTATIALSGLGNFSGAAQTSFAIEGIDLSAANVTGVLDSYELDGAEVVPDLQVSLYGTPLVEGRDYSVSYEGNAGIGTARYTVSGLGGYTGTLAGTFSVVAKKGESDNGNTAGGRQAKTGRAVYRLLSGGRAELVSWKATGAESVKVPATARLGGRVRKVTAIGARAFSRASGAKTIVLGRNVKTIRANAFRGSRARVVQLGTKRLAKATVSTRALAGSRVKRIKVSLEGKKANAKYRARYAKLFAKGRCGKKVEIG